MLYNEIMLTTEVQINFQAGNGGNGLVSFRKGKMKGPDGGNGGRGGNIYIQAVSDIYRLSALASRKKIQADNGQNGGLNKKDGANANNLVIKLPLGTIVTDIESQEQWQINKITDNFLLCRGGRGGRGNFEFRSSVNITPLYAEKGKAGQKRRLNINLKLIADYGLIGFPNAGKSSLLKEITNANPKIASYPFTTLEPNLGECNHKIIADIPGLIEGASSGKGLGIKFLKHIERVSLLLHCLSCESYNLKKDYQTIRNELKKYNPKLMAKKEVILLTKTDLKTEKQVKEMVKTLTKLNSRVLAISIHNWDSLEKLKSLIK